MKKWVVMVAILICCLVYAIVKLSISENQSMSENQNAYKQAEETQGTKQINSGNTDKATPEEGSGSNVHAAQVEAITKPEEGSGSTVPAAQVEAATKVFSEFQGAIKSEDYEQAWKLMSEVFKDSTSDGSFEKFKKEMAAEGAELAASTVHPEFTINIEGRVGLLVKSPSQEQGIYILFNQEDGQWKLHSARPARSADTSKE